MFAEPPSPTIKVLTRDAIEQGGFQRDNTLVLRVPLDLPINFLVKNFREVIGKRHEGKRGRRQITTSKAMFQPKGKVDVAFLETALMVWDARSVEPQKPLWRIAQDLGLGGQNRIREGDPDAVVVDKKNVLAATASRYFRKATLMIKLAAEGHFPHKGSADKK